jgi:uncharacterized protein YbjQ (UPF0145 family)
MSAASAPTRIEAALAALAEPYRAADQTTFVSDLTVGELILLEEVGYRPVDIVWGAGSASFDPRFTTANTEGANWGRAIEAAIDYARAAMADQIKRHHAAGVVAMRLAFEREPFNVFTCSLLGTAVRPEPGQHRDKHTDGSPFLTTLSARDFHLLVRAGFEPTGIVRGAAVVGFAARSVSQSMGLARDNVELGDQTAALYSAREKAMESLEREAIVLGADGVVAVEFQERPITSMLTHAVEFIAIGTAVRRGQGSDAGLEALHPELQLTLDDATSSAFTSS